MKKTALITGASGGMGKAIAHALAEKEFNLQLWHHMQSSENLLHEFTQYSKVTVKTVQADLTQISEIQSLANVHLPVDLIIHAASLPTSYQSISQLTWVDMDALLAINIGSLLELTKVFLPHMQAKKWGRIVGISSALTQNVPTNKLLSYITAKTALNGFVRSLAVELAPFGITANTISPGVTDTSFLDTFPTQLRELVIPKIPLKRLAQPKEIADLVGYLCSDQADYITGIDIPIAGGMVM